MDEVPRFPRARGADVPGAVEAASKNSMSPTLIDTDAGTDDMLALFLLFHLAPASQVDIAVSFGNVPLERAIRNVAMLMELRGLSPQRLLRGAARPLQGEPYVATDVHGDDGLGGVVKS